MPVLIGPMTIMTLSSWMTAAVHDYDPERKYMVLVLDVTPTLPAPQIWFDLFPRRGQTTVNEAAPAQQQENSADGREETISAYIAIEALAREFDAAVDDADADETPHDEPEATIEALAAVKRLTNLFADVAIPNFEQLLDDPAFALENVTLLDDRR